MTIVLAIALLPSACLATSAPSPAPVATRASPPAPSTTPPAPSDSADARAARERLVALIAAKRRGVSKRVLDAMRVVPRHLFVDASIERAYADRILPIGFGQTISQPSVVAVMSTALELSGSERVLEIGTGSGYQAAVLSLLAAHVDSIEILAPLGDAARDRLASLGYANVDVRIGDGYLGWPEHAPYDRILLTAAPAKVPDALVAQLADPGVLVAPVGEGRDQHLGRWRKHGGAITEEDLGPILFVPMVHAPLAERSATRPPAWLTR